MIPRSLVRKNKLTWADRLWVYYELWVLIPCVLGLAFSTWASFHYDDFWAAHIIGFTLLGLPFFFVFVGKCDNPTEDWDDRRKLALYDKARKSAPHKDERRRRYADVEYDQYSVWTERQNDEIVFSILKHVPPVTTFSDTKGDSHWFKYTASKTKKGYAGEFTGVAEIRLTSPTFAAVQENITKLDETAAELERKSYMEGVRRAELEKLTLASRRPEGPARVVRKIQETDDERALEHAIAREYQPSE